MATDNYVNVAFTLPYKTLQAVKKLSGLYNLSQANTLMALVEMGLQQHNEVLEASPTNTNGKKNKHGVNNLSNNMLRKVF